MKKKRLLISTFLLGLFLNAPVKVFACGYDYISSCATQLQIEANGQNFGFFAQNCTYLQNFQNYDFGTVNNLTLNEATTLTWESCDYKVLNSKLFYRIYQNGTAPGSFSPLNLGTMVVGGGGSYRNRTFDAQLGINLLAGLTAGANFTIEIYFRSDVDFNLDNIPDGALTRDNNGNHFKAFFKKGGTVSGISIDLSNKTNPKCSGSSDGSITASATGGFAPYTFSWSNGRTTAINTNLPVGNFTVTVTSATGSSATATTILTAPPPLAVNLTINDETAPTANNGSASAFVSGGTAPYIYAWSTGAAAYLASGLDAGAYSLTVGDAHGCSITKLFSINTSGTVPTGYCGSAGLISWNDFIGEVTLGALNNQSGKTNYSDFTNLPPTQLTIGDIYPLTLKTGAGWFPNQEFWTAWLDANRNGIFETGEIMLNQTSNPPIQGLNQLVATQNFTVPASAAAGITRLRVAVKRGAQPSPCETFQMGEVEDYFVNLVPALSSCNMTATVSSLVCQNNATPTNPADDNFTFNILVNKTGGGAGWTANVNGSSVAGNHNSTKSLGPYLISGGDLTFTIIDNTTSSCRKNVVVAPPSTCSNQTSCTIAPAISDINCLNNGTTGNGADDQFTFNMNVTGGAPGNTGWTTTIGSSNFSGNYGVPKAFGPFNISGGNLNFTVRDAQNPTTCSATVAVTAPAACSLGGGGGIYCTSASAFPWQEWISKVVFSGINKTSGKWTYSDFTSSGAAVVRGQNYPLQLFASFSWDAPPQYFRVWMDYNHDGIFQAATETAWQGILSGAANGALDAQLTGNITIPATAALGETRMRVSMKRGAYPNPCEASVPFGEVEDYSVNIAVSLLAGDDREQRDIDLADFAIFPNPVSDGGFSLNLEKLQGEAVQIAVSHATGRTVFFEKIAELKTGILEIAANDWPTGEYFVFVQSPKMRPVVKKLVVVR